MSLLIRKGNSIPTKTSQYFKPNFGNKVIIEVYQGESEMLHENTQIGWFTLTDIPPSSKGKSQIEVTFEIDANGILNLTAEDRTTGKQVNITDELGGLSKEFIEKARAEVRKK